MREPLGRASGGSGHPLRASNTPYTGGFGSSLYSNPNLPPEKPASGESGPPRPQKPKCDMPPPLPPHARP
eukprot:1194763-Prorocentrum_minimum.AAC.8